VRDRMLVRGLYLPAIAALALAGAGGVAAQRPPRAAKASPHATAPLRFKAIWEPVNYPHDVELDEVLFINADTGFVTGHGSGGVILRTTDGGANWAAALGDPASNQRPFEDLRTDGLGDAFAVQVTGGGDHKLLRSSNGQDWQETGTVPQHRGDYAFVSATTGEGIDGLLHLVADALRAQMVPVDAVVPYERGELVSRARSSGEVSEAYTEGGVRISGHLPEAVAAEVTAAGRGRQPSSRSSRA